MPFFHKQEFTPTTQVDSRNEQSPVSPIVHKQPVNMSKRKGYLEIKAEQERSLSRSKRGSTKYQHQAKYHSGTKESQLIQKPSILANNSQSAIAKAKNSAVVFPEP